MIYREKLEKVAFLDAIVGVASIMFNLNGEKVFGHIKRQYESRLFAEDYNVEYLRAKVEALRQLQERQVKKSREDNKLIDRLEAMGKMYEGDTPLPEKPKQKR